MSEIPKILVVEDDPACRSLYRVALSNQDMNVYLVAESSAALSLLKEGLQCSVIVADYELPDMNGLQLIDEASKFSPVSTKIMVSARGKEELELGPQNQWRISNFLTKPINVKEFLNVVASGIAQYRRNIR